MFLNVHINTQWDDSNLTLLERTPETTILMVILKMNLQNVFIYFLNFKYKAIYSGMSKEQRNRKENNIHLSGP